MEKKSLIIDDKQFTCNVHIESAPQKSPPYCSAPLVSTSSARIISWSEDLAKCRHRYNRHPRFPELTMVQLAQMYFSVRIPPFRTSLSAVSQASNSSFGKSSKFGRPAFVVGCIVPICKSTFLKTMSTC